MSNKTELSILCWPALSWDLALLSLSVFDTLHALALTCKSKQDLLAPRFRVQRLSSDGVVK